MYWATLFISGIIVTIVFWSIFSGKYEGDKIERAIRPKIGAYRIHIHHWMLGFIIFILCIFFEFYHPFILGVSLGTIIHGLSYKDRFIVVYKDRDFEKIYSKFKN